MGDWVYLVHLPLVAALQIWMAPWLWPGVVKFLFLNVATFAVLFASYHYLVRPTSVGCVLNGRRHPFVGFTGLCKSRFSALAFKK